MATLRLVGFDRPLLQLAGVRAGAWRCRACPCPYAHFIDKGIHGPIHAAFASAHLNPARSACCR